MCTCEQRNHFTKSLFVFIVMLVHMYRVTRCVPCHVTT